MEITLKKPEVETLRVNIGEGTYEIPLGASLTVSDYASLNSFEGTIAFYKKYIPEEVADSLTFDEWNQITEAWTKATKKSGRLSSGE